MEREELVGQRDKTAEQRERGGESRAGGVNVHIINLDYLGDRVATSPGAPETAGRASAGSSRAIFAKEGGKKDPLTSFTSCSGARTLARSFKSISPS